MSHLRITWAALRLAGPLRRRGCRFNPSPGLLVKFAHRRVRNEEISHTFVQVVNEEGKLDPPTPLLDVLSRINRKYFFVELVTQDKPIVKILSKKEEYLKGKARRKAKWAAERTLEVKEVQMTWGVATGDLAHKLSKVRKELERNVRVDVIFAPKKKQPVPPANEQAVKADEVLEMLKDVGKESRPRTFQKSLMTLHLQPLGPSSMHTES